MSQILIEFVLDLFNDGKKKRDDTAEKKYYQLVRFNEASGFIIKARVIRLA